MIEAIDLCKHYGSFAAIDHMSFTVHRGEVVAFLGPNGAGKSTTMKVLTGYLTPTSGAARLAGIDVVKDRIAAVQKLGYLPENGPLYPEMTPRELLQFFADARGLSGSKFSERLDFVTGECSLENLLDKPIRKCSKGQKQRVGMAQALLHDPEVLILDEPTTGLDPNQIRHVRELIKKLGGGVRLALAQYRELAAFAQFASDLDEATRKQLERGRLVTELMKQPQYSPMSISEMAVTLYAADKGYFDDVEVKRALECEKAMIGYLKSNSADLMNKMESTADLDGESEKQLAAGIAAFKSSWV